MTANNSTNNIVVFFFVSDLKTEYNNKHESSASMPWTRCYIIAEGFFSYYHFFVGYVLSFSLVRHRTIRLSGRVGAHIEGRCSCSRGEDVKITDVIIKKNRVGNMTGDVNDVMPGSDGLRILGYFWKKKELVEIRTPGPGSPEELRFEPRRGELIFGPGQGQSSWVYEMRRAWWCQMEQSA